MKRTFWCIPVFLLFCILSVKADVLGPYIMDSNVPDTPAGYGRIVLPISGVYVPVNASITVCDEGGKQYVLTAREPGVPPYCYFLACGIYRVIALENCTTQSNWGTLVVGSTFEASGGYINCKRLRDDAKQCKIVLLRYAKALDNIIVIKCN